jgi:CRP/FNR family transcriptional regulator
VPSQVCVAPLLDVKHLMATTPGVAMRVMEQVSRELALSMALAGDYTAEQRLAAFLLHLRDRVGTAIDGSLRLPMAQRDIGNYLRLANETVCRSLKRFEQKGWILAGARGLKLVDDAALREAAAAVGIVRPTLAHAA